MRWSGGLASAGYHQRADPFSALVRRPEANERPKRERQIDNVILSTPAAWKIAVQQLAHQSHVSVVSSMLSGVPVVPDVWWRRT